MNRFLLTAVALAVSGVALAKIPPPDEAAKAKAAEAAAKTAWQGKVDAFLLCKAQDRVAARYKAQHPAKPAAAAAPVTPGTTAAAAPAAAGTAAAAPAAAGTPVAAAAPAAAPAAAAAAKPVPTPATASQGGGTPVAGIATAAPAAIPACADPGPFAYAPPEQKPLETSGAHSPAANASSPPSVRPNSAELAPSKPSVASPKQ